MDCKGEIFEQHSKAASQGHIAVFVQQRSLKLYKLIWMVSVTLLATMWPSNTNSWVLGTLYLLNTDASVLPHSIFSLIRVSADWIYRELAESYLSEAAVLWLSLRRLFVSDLMCWSSRCTVDFSFSAQYVQTETASHLDTWINNRSFRVVVFCFSFGSSVL